MRHRHMVTGTALLLLAGAAYGQQDNDRQPDRQTDRQTDRQPDMDRRSVQASELEFALSEDVIGMEIKNPEGEKIGEIDDLIMNARSGRVTHAVASFGGWLGIGDSVVVVPIHNLNVKGDEAGTKRACTFAAKKEELSQFPTFKPDQWRSLRTSEWTKALEETWNDEAYRRDLEMDDREREMRDRERERELEENERNRDRRMRELDARYGDGGKPLIRLSDISGTDASASEFEFLSRGNDGEYVEYGREVQIADNLEKVGDIDGAVVELRTWRVPFALVTTGGVFGFGADDRLVPWESLRMINGKLVVTRITQEEFKNLPEVNKDELARLSSKARLASLYEPFDMNPPSFHRSNLSTERADASQRGGG